MKATSPFRDAIPYVTSEKKKIIVFVKMSHSYVMVFFFQNRLSFELCGMRLNFGETSVVSV